ncbi:AMP-binding protein [Streptomyces sp. NPDC054863]
MGASTVTVPGVAGVPPALRHVLTDGFLAHARRRPGATALVFKELEITYGALLERVTRQRARVARLPGGEPVGVPAVKHPETIALVLACLLERRPVLLPSATLGRTALERLYGQAGVRHVLDPEGSADDGRPAGRGPDRSADDDRPAGQDPDSPHLAGDRPALLLTTSGSTGAPKIVPLGADAVGSFVRWAATTFAMDTGTRVLNYAPLNFDLCLFDVWATLASGGRVVLVDPDQALNGPRLLDLIDRHRVQVVQGVPMLFQLLADAARESGGVLPHVRDALFTGDVMPGPLLARLPELLPGARLHHVYGCTETNDSFVHTVADARAAAGGPLPLGRPLPGVSALLVGADGSVLEGPGTGELLVSTPFQMRGYLGAGAGAPVFVPHPAGQDARRYFRSGDLVRRLPDGSLILEGRSDHQVKVRGVRVNTQEVEHVLLAHDEVAEAAVLSAADPLAGRLLHAVVRRSPGSALNSLRLRGHLARRLPRAAIPSGLRIVDDPLPRTPTGKIDRQHLLSAHFEEES